MQSSKHGSTSKYHTNSCPSSNIMLTIYCTPNTKDYWYHQLLLVCVYMIFLMYLFFNICFIFSYLYYCNKKADVLPMWQFLKGVNSFYYWLMEPLSAAFSCESGAVDGAMTPWPHRKCLEEYQRWICELVILWGTANEIKSIEMIIFFCYFFKQATS